MNDELMIEKIVYISHNKDSFQIFYSFGKNCENVCSYYTLLKSLGENFVRVNDNTIMNFEYVSKCTDKKATAITGETFMISPKYQKAATNRFFKIKLEKFNTGDQSAK